MLIPIVFMPNLFNGNIIKDDSKIIQNLAVLLNQLKTKGLVIFDSDNCLNAAILNYIEEIEPQSKKVKFQELYMFLKKLKKYSLKVIDIESNLYPECEKVISILKSDSDIICISGAQDNCEQSCHTCIQKEFESEKSIIDINNANEDFLNAINRMSYTSVNEYDIDKIQKNIFKNIIKYSSEFSIYDNQMIPKEEIAANIQNYKIKPNYEYNIKHLFEYIYSINPNLKINLYLMITQEQHRIRNMIESSFNSLFEDIKAKCKNLNVNLIPIQEVCLSDSETKIIHQRYFMSTLITFACDRGLDLIDFRTEKLKDFNISIVDTSDEKILKHHFSNNLLVNK